MSSAGDVVAIEWPKVEDEQAFRHVIYLNDSDVDVDELRRQFQA